MEKGFKLSNEQFEKEVAYAKKQKEFNLSEERCELSNLVALCRKCHMIVEQATIKGHVIKLKEKTL